ncbi:MAG: HesA/MoeB/ThiF family protein [Firmicutes bacterium]|nr:HesA/MoeB/ThiF family protein [Bacillota bacterium]
MLTDKLRQRFQRNLAISDFTEESQEKLLNSSVLVVGCGGLGSPVLMYLAAAGIGNIGLVDSDYVELSNLQRQIIHNETNLGMKKTESAAAKLKSLFPEINLNQYPYRLDSGNIREVFQKYDIIVDACDNFLTRYLMCHAAFIEKKPIIMGAVMEFRGQATTIIPGKTACYACLYPDPPPPEVFPKGKPLGIMGTSPGIIGMIQATEAVKYILGTGELLENTLLLYDGLDMEFLKIQYNSKPDCQVCGQNKTDDLTIWENPERRK